MRKQKRARSASYSTTAFWPHLPTFFLGDLVVHKKKVADVQQWLEYAFNEVYIAMLTKHPIVFFYLSALLLSDNTFIWTHRVW